MANVVNSPVRIDLTQEAIALRHDGTAQNAAITLAQTAANDARDVADSAVKTVNNITPDAAGNVNVVGTGGTSDHADLTNLEFASSGHTGFASIGDITRLENELDNVTVPSIPNSVILDIINSNL